MHACLSQNGITEQPQELEQVVIKLKVQLREKDRMVTDLIEQVRTSDRERDGASRCSWQRDSRQCMRSDRPKQRASRKVSGFGKKTGRNLLAGHHDRLRSPRLKSSDYLTLCLA